MRVVLATIALAACHSATPATGDAPHADDAYVPSRPPPTVATSNSTCKLLSNLNTSDPTANDVQHRANVLGADLGIPVEHDGTLYILFGDTIGYRAIWGAESHPDAVGYGVDSAAAIALSPSLLCNGLRIVTLPPPGSDPMVTADFAGAAMSAPPGHTLGEYIHNPAGTDAMRFPNLPGDFEVPSGAFSYGDSIYAFYTTVVSTTNIQMIGGYLAKWTTPSPAEIPAYAIQYALADDHFINVAAQVRDDYVYLFGTGTYRASAIYLGRKKLAELATPGFEAFDASTRTWSASGTAGLAPIVGTAGYGETSVRYFAEIDRWVILAEESLPTSNRIVAHFADRPEGPWSGSVIVHDIADPAFRGEYCCAPDDNCQGAQMFNCDRTGFYGTYMLPAVYVVENGFSLTYTMSSFDPYNVALFTTQFVE